MVVLSEARTGKTEELKYSTKILRSKDLPAFFVCLEDLAGNYEEFKSWFESEDEGRLLLVSIDEARLSEPRDFERAISKISKKLFTTLDCAHIVLSGRTSAWRSKSNLVLCNDKLPLSQTGLVMLRMLKIQAITFHDQVHKTVKSLNSVS